MSLRIAVAASTLLLAASGAEARSCATEEFPESEARAYLDSRYPGEAGPGAAVLVTCDGRPLFTHNSGMADIEWRAPITSSTMFRLGSISKPLTAVAILRLVEEGRVELDRPVADYVPLLPDYMRPVTVRQLLSHTSGLPDILLTPSLLPFARDWVSEWQVIGMQAKTPPRSDPGVRFEYSNFNYVLLAVLLESVTGRPYGEYMDRKVFEPLDLARTRYDARRSILPERARGYEVSPRGDLLHSENIDMSHASAAGALLSSADDLARWAHLLASGALLSEETLAQAWSPQPLPAGEASSYGLGFNLGEEHGRRVVWHNGLSSGFQAAFSLYPDDGLTVVVLSNGFHLPNTTETMDRIAGLAFQRDQDQDQDQDQDRM